MQVIKRVSDTDTLNLPRSVKSALNDALILPFVNQNDAAAFWSDVGCSLMLIESTDTSALLDEFNKRHGHCLDFITNYPESVLPLTDDNKNVYLLALAITSDDGSGSYLLIPESHPCRYKDNLTTLVDNP